MTIKKWLGYLLFTLCGYLLFLIGTLPATQLYNVAKEQIPGLQLAQIKGSVWDGSAQQLTFKGLQIGPIYWQFKPLSLLFGQIEVALTISDAKLKATSRAGSTLSGEFYLSNLKGESSVEIITSLIPNLPVTPAGSIIFDLEEVGFSDQHLSSATGNIDWQRASVTQPIDIQIGNLNLRLNSDDDGIHGKISDQGATLGIDAQLELQASGQYQIKGKIQPKPNTPTDLINALNILGRPDPTGAISINLSGHL
ncbi:MAG: type II secretion system protein N [Candidatus Polarisedimenticolaceae bacterium]|nr:type II secretion system protein N [Candidatus Polarisedimenticolaceae bacterium]